MLPGRCQPVRASPAITPPAGRARVQGCTVGATRALALSAGAVLPSSHLSTAVTRAPHSCEFQN